MFRWRKWKKEKNSSASTLPPCSNEDCKEKAVKDCNNTSGGNKAALAKKCSAKKASAGEDAEINNKGSLFKATFANKIDSMVCVDLGSDVSLLCPNLFAKPTEKNMHL